MTAKERAQLRGFWTNKQTGKYITVKRVKNSNDIHAWPVNAMGHDVGPREDMLLQELKRDYVKGMH